MVAKKSIVLSGLHDDGKKAVLSLEFEDGTLSGKVRLYNFSSEPMGILSLGLTSQNGIVKAGLTREGNMVFSFGAQLSSMPEDFSCAIINFVGGEPSPILYGSCQAKRDLEETLSQVVQSLKNTNSMQEVEDVLDKNGVNFDDELQAQVQEDIDKCFTETEEKCECKDCQNCMYKKFFYEHMGSDLPNIQVEGRKKVLADEIGQEEGKKEEKTLNLSFYNDIKKQVEVLFSQNKPEEYLENIIPSSKWVKVDFDDGGDYYVFGLIYEDEVLKYVCYGVPGIYSPNPPKQLSGYPFWFPLDNDKREGFGYWLSYQDADTGESIKAIVE